MRVLHLLIDPIISIIYPVNCISCSGEVFIENSALCPLCIDELPYTLFEHYPDINPMHRIFYARFPFQFCYALLFFEQNAASQPILHALKYDARRFVGIQMGELIAQRIEVFHRNEPIDALLPVPIHPKKAFSRGYNQSEYIANGIGAKLGIPVYPNWVTKRRSTESQTRKNRFLRLDNVADKFESRINRNFTGHVVIVDDVLTTGATIEAVVQSIRSTNPQIRISIVTLAITK